MTGPEHYRAAEDYLQDAAEAMAAERSTDTHLFLDFAKAHAMLAKTAATATDRNWWDWAEATGNTAGRWD